MFANNNNNTRPIGNRRTRARRNLRFNRRLGNRANINQAPRNGRSRTQAGASHFDGWTQSRTINLAKTIHTVNTQDGVAYGIGNLKLVPNTNNGTFLNSILSESSEIYEQYRIRRVRVYATPGKNFTNDIRIKSKILARVDRDNFKPHSSANALGVLASSSNTVTKLLRDSIMVPICDFNPVCKPFLPGQSTSDGRQLPPAINWMALRDVNSNKRFQYDEWFGATIGLVTPDEGYQVNDAPSIALTIRVDVQFRGRVFNNTAYSSNTITAPVELPLPSQLVGVTFNIPSLSRFYTIQSGDDNALTFVATYGSSGSDTVTMANAASNIANGVYTNWSGPDISGYLP